MKVNGTKTTRKQEASRHFAQMELTKVNRQYVLGHHSWA